MRVFLTTPIYFLCSTNYKPALGVDLFGLVAAQKVVCRVGRNHMLQPLSLELERPAECQVGD